MVRASTSRAISLFAPMRTRRELCRAWPDDEVNASSASERLQSHRHVVSGLDPKRRPPAPQREVLGF
jgi:hypothetical protein